MSSYWRLFAFPSSARRPLIENALNVSGAEGCLHRTVTYLYYLLAAKKDSILVSLMRGTSNVTLIDDLAEVAVELPPLKEQQRMVWQMKLKLF